jgi:hypothetical protein
MIESGGIFRVDEIEESWRIKSYVGLGYDLKIA